LEWQVIELPAQTIGKILDGFSKGIQHPLTRRRTRFENLAREQKTDACDDPDRNERALRHVSAPIQALMYALAQFVYRVGDNFAPRGDVVAQLFCAARV